MDYSRLDFSFVWNAKFKHSLVHILKETAIENWQMKILYILKYNPHPNLTDSVPSTAPCPQSAWLNNNGFYQRIQMWHYFWGQSHTRTMKWAFLNKSAQSTLKCACTIVGKMWEVLQDWNKLYCIVITLSHKLQQA
jgi:hypothetical protein